MTFEFATAARIIFGRGAIKDIGTLAAAFGTKALVVTGSNPTRAEPLLALLAAKNINVEVFAVPDEPTIEVASAGAEKIQQHGSELVIGFGGGSAIDTAKAVAALAANPGDPLDYLEVIGKAQPLTNPP